MDCLLSLPATTSAQKNRKVSLEFLRATAGDRLTFFCETVQQKLTSFYEETIGNVEAKASAQDMTNFLKFWNGFCGGELLVLFPTLFGRPLSQADHSAAMMITMDLKDHFLQGKTEPHVQVEEHFTTAATPSDYVESPAGAGKIRYLGGRCIAKDTDFSESN